MKAHLTPIFIMTIKAENKFLNNACGFSIKITAFDLLEEEVETIKEITIDETTICSIKEEEILDDLKECIDEVMWHIIDRMEEKIDNA